ncbi:MAG: GNAT family N-acetyltransferase [Acidimicrobiia bacterium]
MKLTCFECGDAITGDDLDSLGSEFVEHARSTHEWPYSDQAIRNYAHTTQRLTGSAERLETIGEITVHRVTEDRIDDWLDFFDHHAFVGTPEWAACYCLEPHVRDPDNPPDGEDPDWRTNREAMVTRLREGETYGYLAYVEGRPAGWVNASTRDKYALYRAVDPGGPEPADVIGVSCFIVAPPYRQHGVAGALLDRVMADATERGAFWVEAYPFNESPEEDSKNFRGPRPMFDNRRFEPIEIRGRDTVVRRSV